MFHLFRLQFDRYTEHPRNVQRQVLGAAENHHDADRIDTHDGELTIARLAHRE